MRVDLHGDITIHPLPGGIPAGIELKPARDIVIAGAKSSPHTIRGEILFAERNGGFFVRVMKSTSVDHSTRHNDIILTKGDHFAHPQRERGDGQDQAVAD